MSTVSTRPPGLLRGWRLTTYLETPRAGRTLSPGSPSCGSGCYTRIHNFGTLFSHQRNGRGRLAVPIREHHLLERGQRQAELSGDRGERGRERPPIAVGRLEGQTGAVATGAEQPVGAALGDHARVALHQDGVGRALAAHEDRVRVHRRGDPVAAVERLEPRERARGTLEWDREGDDAAAVDPGAALAGFELGRRRDLAEQELLQRMIRVPVALDRPAVRAAGGEHPRVLAGAVVVDRLGRAVVLDAAVQLVPPPPPGGPQPGHPPHR